MSSAPEMGPFDFNHSGERYISIQNKHHIPSSIRYYCVSVRSTLMLVYIKKKRRKKRTYTCLIGFDFCFDV
jgi:hypothetical protein